jgi:hypothetical protein
VKNADGSLSIYFYSQLPPGVPASNGLPTPKRSQFDIVLRVYGPEGSVADSTYTPPGPRDPRVLHSRFQQPAGSRLVSEDISAVAR